MGSVNCGLEVCGRTACDPQCMRGKMVMARARYEMWKERKQEGE